MSSQKYALVTGCGYGGIGHALADAFHAQGYTVFATLLPHEKREHLQAAGFHAFSSDVTSESDTLELAGHVSKITGGRLDLLVNCAGIVYTMPAVDNETERVAKMFAVNVLGPMRMVKHFHQMLIATKGVVVNIGSIAGVTPYCYQSGYNASKAALHHYGNTLRVEMQPFGVRVVNVISGEVSTNILKGDANNALPTGSIFEPIADLYQAFCRRTPNTISPKQYAAGVVAEVTKRNPQAWFWFGSQTRIVRWCDAFLPRSFWDWLFWRMFQFSKLAEATAKQMVVLPSS